jgi:hypothetical protein
VVKKTAVPASMFDYDLLSDPEEVNDYFAGICTTDTYNIYARGHFWPIVTDRPTRPYNIASITVQQVILRITQISLRLA